MATKKAAPKKAAKPAPSVKKAATKPAPKKAAAKPTPSKSTKPAPTKAAPKKVAPPAKKSAPASKKTAPAVKQSQKPMAKSTPAKATTSSKKPAVPAKSATKPAAKAVTKAPVKVAAKASPAKSAPKVAAKAPEPVKKPAVAASSQSEVKPAIKPMAAPAKKEPAKPARPFVVPKTSTTKSVKYNPDFTKSVLDANRQREEDTTATQRYSDNDLKEFRDLINRKLDTAKKELAYLQGLVTRKDESGDMDEGRYMTMEDGSMSMEREQLSQMASRQIQFIDHLEKAIMRIENKTYGICRVTGKLIDKARLRAVPHATLSIEAKQMMNK
jgi:RNA polymerase-binding transcription factor DksA